MSELKYSTEHEWISIDGDIGTVGISGFAQDALGDVVFVELPEVGAELHAGDEAGVVESVKAASEIFAPISGQVVAVNEVLAEAPETVNADPYNEGWFFTLLPSDTSELESLLDAEAYLQQCED